MLVPLGFSMSFPDTLQCELCPISSLSLEGINVSLGTIDPDYRGELKAIVSNTMFNISIGQRIGQLVFTPVAHPQTQIVDSLTTTLQGKGGFGSSGTNAIKSRSVQKSPMKFIPVLPLIPEHLPKVPPHQPPQRQSKNSSVTIDSINSKDLDILINLYTHNEYKLEDVTPSPKPKTVFPDAIPLFPMDMYKTSKLNITGIPEYQNTGT